MTNEELLDDLKQYIDDRISQTTAGLATKEDIEALDKRFGDVDRRFDEVDIRFNDIDKRFDEVDIRLNEIQNAVGAELSDHELRIGRLEKKLA